MNPLPLRALWFRSAGANSNSQTQWHDMNDQLKSIWQRELLPGIPIFKWPRQFFGWLFSWRGVRRILIVLAWTVTLLALFYGEENWRGRHAWMKYRRALEAGGAQLDYRAFIPKPIPDEQNFAAAPVIKSWFVRENFGQLDKLWNDDYSRTWRNISDARSKWDWSNRHFTDLAVWEKAFSAIRSGKTNRHQMFYETNKLEFETRAKAATAVLDGFRDSEPHLANIRAASQRPYSRYQIGRASCRERV